MLYQKNKRGMYNTHVFLLPITNTLFIKKPIQASEENKLDFHLDMIKKIDALLEEHDIEPPIEEPTPQKTASPEPHHTPIEIRPPLDRRPGQIGPAPPQIQELSFPKSEILPEEFKTDPSLEIKPEFRFITSLEGIESTLDLRPLHHERIEIIDLGEFKTHDITKHFDTPTTIIDFPDQQNHKIKKQGDEDILSFTIHDSFILNQKESQQVLRSAEKQNQDIEKKKQIFYQTRSKTKNESFNQVYDSENVEETLQMLQKKLQEKQQKENSKKLQEQEKKQQKESDEKRKRQLEREEQQKQKLEQKLQKELERVDQKKHKIEEKIKLQLEREQERYKKLESKKGKTKERNIHEKKEEPRDEEPPVSLEFTKKQLKEQRRLERLAARQAIFEERLKIKKEKRLLKEQKKHLELMKSDSIEKYTPEPIDLDSDIKKILQITDELLGELPEDVISRFMRSDEYDIYEHIINKYKIR